MGYVLTSIWTGRHEFAAHPIALSLQVMNRTRSILLTVLPTYATTIRALPFHMCAWVLAVYQVELLRVRKGGIPSLKGKAGSSSLGDTMLKYVTEERLAGNDVWNVIEGVGDEVRGI